MSKRTRRILVTVAVLALAAGVLAAVFFAKPPPTGATAVSGPTSATQPQTPAEPSSTSVQDKQPTTAGAQPPKPSAPASSPGAPPSADEQTPRVPLAPAGMKAVAAGGDVGPRDQPRQSLGSLDPRISTMQVEFSLRGASIARVAFADIWETAEARRQAQRYLDGLQPGTPYDVSHIDETHRYVVKNIAAAHSIMVNGAAVDLLAEDAWSETAPGKFESNVVDGENRVLLHLTRQFALASSSPYDIALQQTAQNRTDQPLQVQWLHYGPTDLAKDLAGYIDRRRFDLGYVPDPARQPDVVLAGDFQFERGSLLKTQGKAAEAATNEARHQQLTLWPPPAGNRNTAYELSWFGSMNRYFSVAVHPSFTQVSRGTYSLKDSIGEISFDVAGAGSGNPVIYTWLRSPALTLEASAERTLEMGVYVGPLDRHVLGSPPFDALAMSQMILYSMGGCCTFMSFQWLAKLLLSFLSLLHNYLVFDWGIAIMLLVVVVRTLLHPLTKKSQVNMQRFGKVMSAIKPELDKLQKKFAGDPKRLQVEQMKLMREHGLNPFQMLGCLPMFLQMPIWIALWAMLYLAFEIRHQPAFYGIFQLFNDWKFLGDLSSPDHFWMLPGGGFTIPLVGWQVDALNLLPLLLGVVFFIQQKYMSPPPTPNMTPEQKQQQKIMKVMMVVLFPLMLYKAPSGLTLYIFTSTFIGIIESKYIRAHVNQMDLGKPGAGGGTSGPGGDPPKKPKDTLGRMWAEKLEAARAKRAAEPSRTFKKRK